MARTTATLATTNLNLAAALGTCRVEVTIDKFYDDCSGDDRLTFYLSARNSPHPDDCKAKGEAAQEPDEEEEGGGDEEEPELAAGAYALGGPMKFETEKLLKRFHSGWLTKNDPTHPLMDCLRAEGNRECLLTWIKKGRGCRIAIVNNAPRAVLMEGGEPWCLKVGRPDFETWTTDDLKLAAVLPLVGVPVVGVTMKAGRAEFTLPRWGYEIGGPAVDAVALTLQLEGGELKRLRPGHPVVWGYQCLLNREKLLRLVKEQREQVLLRRPKSGDWKRDLKSALVRDDSSDEVLDRAMRHLRRT